MEILEYYVVMLIPISYLCIFSQISASSQCPIDFNYVLKIPWDSSSCQNNITDKTNNCCQTLTSLIGIGTAKHLKETSRFRLKDLQTSVSCISDFQNKLSSLNLPENLTSSCFQPQQFVNMTSVCGNVQTKDDWLRAVGPATSLDKGCKQDLSDLTACDACVIAGFQVQSQLLAAFGGNSSDSRGCFYYTILYAAGVVNELGPESDGAISCIFGLPLILQTNARKWVFVYGLVGGGCAVVLVACLAVFYLIWGDGAKVQQESVSFPSSESDYEEDGLLNWRPKADSLWFKIQELEKATDKFSAKNLIGKGQFGSVYKGRLQDRTMIAVKKVDDSDFQGDDDFRSEVEIIGTLKHRNLVPLRGCCVWENQKYLVYDYMPNGNLDNHLFPFHNEYGRKFGKFPMSWPQRKNIILDVANALAYLHHGVKPPIYHRDIKPTNILLDSCMRARVADFGLAKQGNLEGESHLTTRIAGTHGYLAPEYALYGQLTEKSDVYSFGIVVLEIMCGRKALDLSSSSTVLITDWAWLLMKSGKMDQVFDPALIGRGYPKMVMERFVMVGILCAHLMVALRPTMVEALKMLEGDIEVPSVPDRPLYASNMLVSVDVMKRPQSGVVNLL